MRANGSVAEDRFAAAMKGRSFNGRPPVAPAAAPKPVLPVPPGLLLGESETGGAIAVDLAQLLVGRLMIQGMSGAGKSYTLRRLLEQAAGQVQEIVIDPEGEFESLATELGILFVKGHQLDIHTARTLGARVREHRISLVLDTSDMDHTARMILVTAFLEALVAAPREHWHPCLVAIDEAHLFAPWGDHSMAPPSVRKAAVGAVVDVMGRGRKRGLCGVLATLRIRRLATSARSEVQNFLIGQNTQDLDIDRAAEHLGWPRSKAADRLPELQPGDFVAVGRAFSTQPAILHVGPVRSAHRGAAPAISAPPTTSADQAATALGLDQLIAEAEADSAAEDDNRLSTGGRAIRDFLRDPAFVAAGAVFGTLREISPRGATLKAIAKHLGLGLGDVGPAVTLLDQFGALEFGEDTGEGRPVALDREFARPLKKDRAA